ncbi:unnamed protein product, partial [Amoebophrya sp. A120]
KGFALEVRRGHGHRSSRSPRIAMTVHKPPSPSIV